jgi:pimeloyl-ACP methyl ester carboxylesterase
VVDGADRVGKVLDQVRAYPFPMAPAVEDGWSYGCDATFLKDICAHWTETYDWQAAMAGLNRYAQFTARIEDYDLHFVHVVGEAGGKRPLLLTHGWPGSHFEFWDSIEKLAFPSRFGGKAEDAFDLVIPSLPGFGFSGKPTTTGWGVEKIAQSWATLMSRLGYTRWVAQGGDWGSAVTSAIGAQAPEGCIGIHVNMPMAAPAPEDLQNPGPRELQELAKLQHYQQWDSGYSKQQATRPQTLGYGLADSPVGQAAWIYEKMWSWTDNDGTPESALTMDEMLDNIMLYWLPNTGTSSARLYWESFGSFAPRDIHLPAGVSLFPKEIMRPTRKWVETSMHQLIHWNELDKGGHFAAWEQPELYVNEVRTCFRQLR